MNIESLSKKDEKSLHKNDTKQWDYINTEHIKTNYRTQ